MHRKHIRFKCSHDCGLEPLCVRRSVSPSTAEYLDICRHSNGQMQILFAYWKGTWSFRTSLISCNAFRFKCMFTFDITILFDWKWNSPCDNVSYFEHILIYGLRSCVADCKICRFFSNSIWISAPYHSKQFSKGLNGNILSVKKCQQ